MFSPREDTVVDMLKKIVYRLLTRGRARQAKSVEVLREKMRTREAIEAYQLKWFNEIWAVASREVPFYRAWKTKYNLPESVRSLSELAYWPILTKADLREVALFERKDLASPTAWLMTGGSSGEPVRLPAWPEVVSGVSQSVGRAAYGVGFGSKTLLLWGHEHLYGKGLRRYVNIFKRRFKDWLSDWCRVSAYDLSETAMRRAYRKYASFRPEFVIGFSAAVLAFVRQNAERSGEVKGVRAVLCTAGPLTADEKDDIRRFFGAPVCMEYGSVECGVMAYTNPKDDEYDVFWNTHLLQIKEDVGEARNLVTRLTKTYVPLIRYDIGDYLELDAEERVKGRSSVLRICNVKGRPTEMIHFACGVSFFGALIGDCVKQVSSVVSSQLHIDERNDRMEIWVTTTDALSDREKELIVDRFRLTVEGAEKILTKVVNVEKLYMTTGGKTPRIVREGRSE